LGCGEGQGNWGAGDGEVTAPTTEGESSCGRQSMRTGSPFGSSWRTGHYDFCARHEGQWKIVRRQPIYEKDRLDVVDPAGTLTLDPALLARFPVGDRPLRYLQTRARCTVNTGLPGLTGEAIMRLYDEGAKWLDGSPSPGAPR